MIHRAYFIAAKTGGSLRKFSLGAAKRFDKRYV